MGFRAATGVPRQLLRRAVRKAETAGITGCSWFCGTTATFRLRPLEDRSAPKAGSILC